MLQCVPCHTTCRHMPASAEGVFQGGILSDLDSRGHTRWRMGAGDNRSDSYVVQNTPAIRSGRAAHTGIDEAIVGGAFRDQIPAAHPLVGAFKLLHRI